MTPSYFITGTGTDIGKTFVTAALVRAARRAGQSVCPLKPLLSGVSDLNDAECDAAVLAAAHGDVEPGALVQQTFAAPLSPDHAAALEGRRVDVDALCTFVRDAQSVHGTVLVEGVGGVMVPLDETLTVRDWIVRLDLDAVVVASNALGTLSHTLSALCALADVGVSVRMVIVNAIADDAPAMDDTLRSLRAHTAAVVMPFRDGSDADTLWAALAPGSARSA